MSRDIDPLIMVYQHEKQRPREKDALFTLRKIASLVKPLMRVRGWKVGTLSEFYPDKTNLLGLNVNRGAKICLRLRYPGDATQFLPIEDVTDTMLHELAHNVFGPHDERFHALWNQLREEYDGLLRKGYTGEGFMSQGRRLGGSVVVPHDEARRIARAAAERRRDLSSGSGQRLGGAAVRKGQDIRRVIVDAIERRARITRGCAATNHSAQEIQDIADSSTSSGFKTKAEEDKANDQAIAQALWELMQEEEQQKYGTDYVPVTRSDPVGNGGGTSIQLKKAGNGCPKPPLSSSSPPHKRSRHGRPADVDTTSSRIHAQDCTISKKVKNLPVNIIGGQELVPPNLPLFTTELQPVSIAALSHKPDVPSRLAHHGLLKWLCPVCTCHNPETFLCCDACASQRPAADKREMVDEDGKRIKGMSQKPMLKTWVCHGCGNEIENHWWTCNVCETVKLSS